MTKNNTVIERFRKKFKIVVGAKGYEWVPIKSMLALEQVEQFLTEELERRDKEIVEEIRDWAIIDNGITHKKSFIALWNKLDDIEQMIERK